jgi:Family of unknown function (DUF5519)
MDTPPLRPWKRLPSANRRLWLVDLLESKIEGLNDVQKKKSRWTDNDAFYIDGREFAHFHGDHKIDVRLTRGYQKRYSSLIGKDPRVGLRQRPSQWITADFQNETDVRSAFKIVRLALRANRKERTGSDR